MILALGQDPIVMVSVIAPDPLIAPVKEQMKAMYLLAIPSYMGYNNVEYSFTIKANGTANKITSDHEGYKTRVFVVPGDLAIIHTHPSNGNPRPSSADIATAVQLGIPNYELSQNALWIAMPNGTVRKVGKVSFNNNEILLP